MDRSLRFRVYRTRLDALLGLGFPSASPIGLTSPHTVTRRPIMQKVRGDALPCGHSAPTACRHTVSGTISLPSRGTFHHSLTVLIHYRSSGSIQAYQVVLADSHGIPRAPCYSGTHTRTAARMTTTGLSPSLVRHSNRFTYTPAPHPASRIELAHMDPTTPKMQRLSAITHLPV